MPRLKGLRKRRQSWYYRIRDGRNGEKEVPLGKDPDKALAKALELRRGSGRPLGDERPRLTVADAAKQWLEDSVKHTRSERFHHETERRVERYLKPAMGQERIEEVTARSLFTYRNWLTTQRHWRTGKPLSAGTIRHILGEVRLLLNYCLTVGLLDRSPIPPRGWMPKLEERAPDTLGAEECIVLRALREPYGRVIRFLLASGLRWGELVRAQVSDIRDGVLVVSRSKSGKVRRVPLPASVLREYRSRVGRVCPFTDSVSFNRRVREIVAEHLATLTDEQRKPLEGLSRFHVHLTRHTFASEWRDAGGSLAGLQAVLGHSSVTVTERYGKIADDLVLREARRLEEHRKALGA